MYIFLRNCRFWHLNVFVGCNGFVIALWLDGGLREGEAGDGQRRTRASEFGSDGMVETPLGIVKMGAYQYEKLADKKRTGYFGMIRPTLSNPDVVIEKAAPAENAERDTKYLFVKTFVKLDGSRVVHFESITVRRDGMEVSISSHEAEASDIKKICRTEKSCISQKSCLPVLKGP